MDLRQLRYFLALTEHRSFVRAADAMRITQPAFSRSIQGLEQELGCQLVDRGSKDLRPTPEGLVLIKHAQELVRGAGRLVNEIQQMGKLDAGQLRLGCTPLLATRLLPDALIRFMASHPRLQTRLDIADEDSLGQRLGNDQIELFVADTQQAEADPEFQVLPLRSRARLFFCRPRHPLLNQEQLSPRQLFDYPLVCPHLSPEARSALITWSGHSQIHTHTECEPFFLQEQIVSRSDAIGLGSEEALQASIDAGRQVVLPLRGLPTLPDILHSRCGIVVRRDYRLSPAARAMIEQLTEQDRVATTRLLRSAS